MDLVEDVIGDYRAFAEQQQRRLARLGIDITPYALSHLAYRVPEWDQYVHVRELLERHAVINRENLWNGRPISLIVPRAPLRVLDGKPVPLVELIPPVHQRVYKMGLEHLGVVVGEAFDDFVAAHKPVLTGQQFQGPDSNPDPVYILFEDFTHVKLYRESLRASVEAGTGPFPDGFHHVGDWAPQRIVTATGPNPLPDEDARPGSAAPAVHSTGEDLVNTTTVDTAERGRSPLGAHIRFLVAGPHGNMIHSTVPPGMVGRACHFRTIDEYWFVLAGEGEVWRRAPDGHESVTSLTTGVCIDIPLGTTFQYRCTGSEPFVFTCTALPPWPGNDEAVIVEGRWAPRVDPTPETRTPT